MSVWVPKVMQPHGDWIVTSTEGSREALLATLSEDLLTGREERLGSQGSSSQSDASDKIVSRE